MFAILSATVWLGAASLFGLPAFGQQGTAEPVQKIYKAAILLTDSETLPPADAEWQPQDLPDNWSRTRPGVGGFAWYRLEFELAPTALQLSALYVARFNINGQTYVNGEAVGGNGQMGEPPGLQWYRPQFYPVPAKLLKPGVNQIHIRIKAYANSQGGLSEVVFGPSALVEGMWSARYLWQVTSIQITSAITLGLGILALLAWSLRRWDTAFGYFGAAALIWVARNGFYLMTETPIRAFYWAAFGATLQIWVLSFVFMFVLRFAGQALTTAERLIWAFSAVAPFVLLAAGHPSLALVSNLMYLVMLLIGAYIVKVTFDVARRERSVGTLLLVCASLVVYGLGAHDWFTHRNALSYSEPLNLHFGAPILFIVVAWNMFKRFHDAQKKATELAETLEVRVQEKNAELQYSYDTLRAVEASQAKAQERGRIMQDMHDGLGSQLVSSLAMAQVGELSSQQTYDLLRSCIDDLRLAIDTSTDSRDSLALALGNLRFRMAPRLQAAGITLKWNTAGLQDDLPLPAEKQLPILRVIQETITNTLKHAQAKTLHIVVASSATELSIEINDDGQGFDVEAATKSASGKGLNSLDKRARVLGARLTILSNENGTGTHLVLPLSDT